MTDFPDAQPNIVAETQSPPNIVLVKQQHSGIRNFNRTHA